MKKRSLAAFAAMAFATSLGAQAQLLVSAASSLTDVLSSLKGGAERRIGAPIVLNFGASGNLRRQIEEGAPVDVYFSAASADMDSLEKAGLIVPGSRRDLLSNSIVLVGDRGIPKPKDAEALRPILASAELLAIGNPDSVPAGRYGVEALKSLGLYAIVGKKLVLGGTAREVLQYLESGSAPLGIVFLTDAQTIDPASPIGELYRFPESALARPVIYPIAVIAASKAKERAAAFIRFLAEPASSSAFSKAGFTIR
jgi:molybdate transport system substrate-binding protein